MCIRYGEGKPVKDFVVVQGSIPKVYIDGVGILWNEFGFTLVLGNLNVSAGGQEGHIDAGILAGMSPQTAKALQLLISKMIREYEEKVGSIVLSNKFLHDIGLEEDVR